MGKRHYYQRENCTLTQNCLERQNKKSKNKIKKSNFALFVPLNWTAIRMIFELFRCTWRRSTVCGVQICVSSLMVAFRFLWDIFKVLNANRCTNCLTRNAHTHRHSRTRTHSRRTCMSAVSTKCILEANWNAFHSLPIWFLPCVHISNEWIYVSEWL